MGSLWRRQGQADHSGAVQKNSIQWILVETTEVQTGHKEKLFTIRTLKFWNVVPRESGNPVMFFKP